MSKSATPPPQTLQFHATETAVCDCDAAIPGDMIRRRLLPTSPCRATRERMTALCIHCDSVWAVDRELRGAFWTIIAGPKKLSGRRRAEALAHFDKDRAIQRIR